MNLEGNYLQLLIVIMTLEAKWSYYQQTEGIAYGDDVKTLVMSALRLKRTIDKTDDAFFEKVNSRAEIEIVERWAEKDEEAMPHDDVVIACRYIDTFIWFIKKPLFKKVGISENNPALGRDSFGMLLSNLTYVRWSPHLFYNPFFAFDDLNKLMSNVSASHSICVYGDIRRSQDLMTYANSADDFSKYMIDFIQVTRKLLNKYYGIFDKFTGDGFIAYFNEKLCAEDHTNYLDCFLNFVREEINLTKWIFGKWANSIRKRPDEQIGLVLGADVGIIDYRMEEKHFIAIGDTIVWANRMSSAAKANEIVVNNLLHSELESLDNLNFTELKGQTKAGEKFTAWKMGFNDE